MSYALTLRQKKVGTLPKDSPAGPFADEWKKAYGDISKEVEEVDISAALSIAAFAVKDENELVGIKSTFIQRSIAYLWKAVDAQCRASLYGDSLRIFC